ncbi:nucleoside hydrolase [Ferrimonas marina]|uniref:Inosine-uridine nucleoside N-ribohydrolase n=1 Tax=Ferrimonas marina TaxID=299255 RepID=A0A1M5NXZ3_9GAMM|nr:nucleoside hydrolase [Ferrimonas marina]SHG94335.1 Inosine-uridine nucleoside N-ribohydrolase [Ferrimonas marina]
MSTGKDSSRYWLAAALLAVSGWASALPLVVITDMEPDDRIALELLMGHAEHRLVLVGSTVMHASRKQALAQQVMTSHGLEAVPVVVGSGGQAEDFPAIQSSAAARAYEQEGQGILDPDSLRELNLNQPRSDSALRHALCRVLKQHEAVEILLLAPPTDLAAVLQAQPELQGRIEHIHVMGGWVEHDGVLRTTYNWNMDPSASAALMAMEQIPMTLFSSDLIKQTFQGGSISRTGNPVLFEQMQGVTDSNPAMADFFTATASWDQHVLARIPALVPVIGDDAGYQFTPADPLLVGAMRDPAMVLASEPVSIQIDLEAMDPQRGYAVEVTPNPDSRINWVTEMDPDRFLQLLSEHFNR